MTNQETLVALGSDLRIGRAGEIFDLLTAAAHIAKTVTIDGSEVSKVDTAGLQALVAGVICLRNAGAVWHWQNGSAALISAAEILDLEETLRLR